MSHDLIKLNVQKFDTRQPNFDELDSVHRDLGQKSSQVFQTNEDANSIVIIQESETAEGMQSFYGSDSFHSATARARVIGPQEMTILNPVS